MPVVFPFHILQDHDKPEQGEACNHCGLCCRVQACEVSETFLQSSQTPCIALEVHDGNFLCGMMIRPHHYLGITLPDADTYLIPHFKLLLGSGQGCGMPDEVIAVKVSAKMGRS
jgi:hypothetical protein